MSFKVKLNNEEKTFDKKIKLLDLTNNDKDIICADVNGRIRELDYEVYYDATVKFLKKDDHDSSGIYERGIRFIFAMAAHLLYPNLRFKLTYSVSRSIYAQIDNLNDDGRQLILTEEMAKNIEDKMREIVRADYPFKRLIKTNDEAKVMYEEFNSKDKLEILQYRPEKTVHFYNCNNYFNYMYGKMVPSTGYLKEFKLLYYTPGLLIQYPRSDANGEIPPFEDEPKFAASLMRAREWGKTVELSTISEINSKIDPTNTLTSVNLINICEAKHNRMLCELGQKIESHIEQIRLICIAGPSSSGKTTFADRLTIELKSRGINPIRVSMDDYYKNKKDVPIDEDGNYDFESVDALDKELFNKHIIGLLNGETVALPEFDFKTNTRVFKNPRKIGPHDPIIIEGIHALNEIMTASIPKYMKFKIYISPQIQLNLDNETPISLTDVRLLRRIVRDYSHRGASAEETLSMWPSVRKGEFKWIYKTQEDADFVFDSFLNYELCVLAKHAQPLLQKIDKDSEFGPDVERLLSLLKYFTPIKEEWIPSNSIIKEFVGGSCYRDPKMYD